MSDPQEPPLCVDLDGTLLEGDTLVLSVRGLLRQSPWQLIALPFALLRGRAALKEYIANRFLPDPSGFVWREEVLAFLRSERLRGRAIVLATAAHRRVAESVATHLGLFDGVVATQDRANAKGVRKAELIRKLLGRNDFDYVGDSLADVPVFEAARLSYLVSPSETLRAHAGRVARVAGEFCAEPGRN